MRGRAWERVKELFWAASELEGAARVAYLDRECGRDAALRREVESLLGSRAELGGFLEVPAAVEHAPDVAPPTEAPRERIGDYRVREVLGRGGMGVVYAAEDPRLRRTIAIKVLPEWLHHDAEAHAQFEREARLLASLNHPNIATIHSLEEADGESFFTLELVPGDTLTERLAGGPLAVADAVATTRQIALALEAAHDNGVVHCDLKPANVTLLPDGRVKVLDFGIARVLADRRGDPALAGGMNPRGGTPGYMSPEQVEGGTVDARTDVWALACIFYECLTGHGVFVRAGFDTTLRATLEEEPDLELLPTGLDARLQEIIEGGLVRERAYRIPTARAVRRLLDEWATHERHVAHEAVPATETVTTPSNLPRTLSSFVGRKAALGDLAELLTTAPLVTLTGVGGCGKSRLAIEVGSQLLDRYPDGVWLVELAAVTDTDWVPHAVGQVLGLRQEPEVPYARSLVLHLASRRVLIVLDNCEHLLSACAALVKNLLAGCPGVSVLATSREGLALPGEHVYAVPPLQLPPADAAPREEIEACESVHLFLERAHRAREGFELDASNADTVASICRRLDGLPLAIELAAARVRMLDIDEIAARMADRFRLLTGGARTALPRQQTLRGAIEWSYGLLDESERRLLRRLSVLAGSWTLETAEGICAFGDLHDWEVLDLLGRLVDKSLVEVELEPTTGSRYRLLETVRVYAREQLLEAGEIAQVRDRHRDYFVELAHTAKHQIGQRHQARWYARLAVEHENFQDVLGDLMAEGGDAVAALCLACDICKFWEVRGYAVFGLERILDLLDRTCMHPDTAERARGLDTAGVLAKASGRLREARDFHAQALAMERRLGRHEKLAQCISNLGVVEWMLCHHDRARELYEECLARAREHGAQRTVAGALGNLGSVLEEQGKYDEARKVHQESLELLEEIGDHRGIAVQLNNLGVVAMDLDDFAGALDYHQRSMAIRVQLGERRGEALSLNNMGELRYLERRFAEAGALFEQALTIYRELDDEAGVAELEHFLGRVACEDRNLDEARHLLDRSRRALADHNALGQAFALEGLAQLALASGTPERAVRLHGAAQALRTVRELPLRPPWRRTRDAELARAREMLGDTRYQELWQEGMALTAERALAEVRAAGSTGQ